MNDDNSLKRFRKRSAEIANKQARLEEELAKRPASPQTGDIFIFKNPKTIGFQWVILGADKPQYLSMVPADNNPLVGSNDLGLSDRALCGPLTLRCGYNFRINKDKFKTDCLRVGILEDWDLLSASDKIKEISAGSVRSTVLQQEADHDPDYEDWIEEVKQAVDARREPTIIEKLISWIKNIGEKLVVFVNDFITFVINNPRLASASFAMVLVLAVIFWPHKNLIDSSYQTIYAIQTTSPTNQLSLASLSLKEPANVQAFSQTPQASQPVQAFTAGFLTGKKIFQGETVTKNKWLDTQWASYFELGRWTFLLESVCKSLPEYRIPQGFWEQQQEIFTQLNGEFSEDWVRIKLKKIGSLLEQLPNQPQLSAELADKLKSMREGLTPLVQR